MFNIDIDSLGIDFSSIQYVLFPHVSYDKYKEYFIDVPEGIDEWSLGGIFTAEVLLRRKGEL